MEFRVRSSYPERDAPRQVCSRAGRMVFRSLKSMKERRGVYPSPGIERNRSACTDRRPDAGVLGRIEVDAPGGSGAGRRCLPRRPSRRLAECGERTSCTLPDAPTLRSPTTEASVISAWLRSSRRSPGVSVPYPSHRPTVESRATSRPWRHSDTIPWSPSPSPCRKGRRLPQPRHRITARTTG